MSNTCVLKWLIAGIILTVFPLSGLAIDVVAEEADNTLHWHFSEKLLTATFLGGDKPESAVLLLKKSAIMGRTITLESDGSFIVLQSGKVASPHIIFQVAAKTDSTLSKLLLSDGDQPTLFLNDKEQMQQQGKWIQILSTTDATIHLEIKGATFAKVTFSPPADAKTPAAAHSDKTPAAVPAKGLLHSITARQLQLASDNFHAAILKKCTRCNGDGKVTVQVQTGTRQEGILSYPVYEGRTEQCQKCKGTGIDRSSDEVLIRLSGTLVKGVANVKEDDPKKQETLTKVYAEITDQMIGDRKTWTLLTSNGKSILAQNNPVPGTAVVALVAIKQSIKSEDDHRRYLVRVIGTDKEVYVDDPVLADELKSGHALMGGLVDKSLPDPNGPGHTTVLRAGFLIAPEVNQDWYWWYKDYK